MFYLAEAVLISKQLNFSSHKSVISLFGEHFIRSGDFPAEYGKWLNRAFDKRMMSDYDYTVQVKKEDAEDVLTKAVTFVTEIRHYLSRKGLIQFRLDSEGK